MEEIWKGVKGYENLYQVSNLGRIKSLTRKVKHYKGGYRFVKERIMKLAHDMGGYVIITLSEKPLRRQTKTVHQLVAIAFLNHIPCNHTLVVDHKDFNKDNNKAENLRIVTSRNNPTESQNKGSSKYTGVSWNKRSKKWIARISINNKQIFLGYFINELGAAKAYQDKLKSLSTFII